MVNTHIYVLPSSLVSVRDYLCNSVSYLIDTGALSAVQTVPYIL